MTEDLKARVAELEAQLAGRREARCLLKVSEKGAVSLYGLGRFPVTLYKQQWERLLRMAPEIEVFLVENAKALSVRKGG